MHVHDGLSGRDSRVEISVDAPLGCGDTGRQRFTVDIKFNDRMDVDVARGQRRRADEAPTGAADRHVAGRSEVQPLLIEILQGLHDLSA
jgi:hypothetical protein